MNELHFVEQLSSEFKIIGAVDVADLTVDPAAAYRFFKNLYKQEYASNERILVYTSHHVDRGVLAHLYKTVNLLDIGNWFILICSQHDLQQQLTDVCSSDSIDPSPFQFAQVVLENTKPLQNNYALPKTFCAIPWGHLEVQSNGSITPCCMSSMKLGNVQNMSLSNAFTSPAMDQLRGDLLAGKKPDGCSNCWVREAKGLTSIRQHSTHRLEPLFLSELYSDKKITSLDIKFQNVCNFKCRICNPDSSSLFASEHSKVNNIPLVPQLNWSDSDKFINEVNSLLPHLTNIDMFGGEPFLIKKFKNVLDTAVESECAKNIRLHYNSNGSVWPGEFVNSWKHFSQVDLHFSIDAIGDRFNLQRGNNWETVERNILKLKALSLPNISIAIMPSISIMNVYYINEVLDWAHAHQFPVYVSHVVNPSAFSLKNLTKEAKDMIIEKHSTSQWPEMKNILDYIKSMPTSDGVAFCNMTRYFDNIRNENFSETHTEIANAMHYQL